MRRLAIFAFAALLSPAFLSTSAHAQNPPQRLWVSGTGDDTKSCARDAPCLTFTTAVSRAPAGSEINCVDSGSYSGATITKALTINCEGALAGVRYATTGFTISAGPDEVVILRGLTINGNTTETTGIKFNSGKALVVENSIIYGNNGTNGLGIAFNPSGASFLTIINTTITNNGSASGGGGIQLAPASGGFGLVQMENVRVTNNYIGIGGAQTVNATISNSNISNNRSAGISVSGGATVRLMNSTIAGNGAAATAGNVFSFGNNAISNNSPDTTPPLVALR